MYPFFSKPQVSTQFYSNDICLFPSVGLIVNLKKNNKEIHA